MRYAQVLVILLCFSPLVLQQFALAA